MSFLISKNAMKHCDSVFFSDLLTKMLLEPRLTMKLIESKLILMCSKRNTVYRSGINYTSATVYQ